jgi:hypothetical protein
MFGVKALPFPFSLTFPAPQGIRTLSCPSPFLFLSSFSTFVLLVYSYLWNSSIYLFDLSTFTFGALASSRSFDQSISNCEKSFGGCEGSKACIGRGLGTSSKSIGT